MRDSMRVCLLTGAAGVLGADFCRRWRHDYAIAAVYRNGVLPVATRGERFVDPLAPRRSLAANDEPVFGIRADLRKPDELERVVELTLARFGRIDVLVNAAAHVHPDRLISLAVSGAPLDDAFAVNTTMPIQLAAIVARRFWLYRREDNEAFGRNVVNVSSMAAFGVVPGVGLSAYSASKVALNMLTGHLAAELAPVGVRVNALAPTTFPRLIPTALVSDAVVDLDRSDLSGMIVQLDEHGARTAPFGVATESWA